jgi:hypothetical protein
MEMKTAMLKRKSMEMSLGLVKKKSTKKANLI